MAVARRIEEELLIINPEQEVALPLPVKDNIVVLPRKIEVPEALYNYSLMRYMVVLCLVILTGSLLPSLRASYAFSVSQGISEQNRLIEDLHFENTNLAAKIVEATSLENLESRALALGFLRYDKEQIYQLPDGLNTYAMVLD